MPVQRFLAFFLFVFILCLPRLAAAQSYKISGRIVDSETLEPLPYAHVFIDQTTIGAVSDFNGEYVIENISNGEYKLVFSFVGYELFYKVASVNEKDVRVSARLVPQKELLQNIEVKGARDKEWEGQLRQFNRVFFGDNEFASKCKILNPWVLEFTYDKRDKKFKATASEPIEFENMALGYRVTCNLQGFSFDKKSYRIKGLYKFEEINTLDAKEASRWTKNRRQAYQSSLRFLVKSIVDHHENENGFRLYLDNRPAIYTSHTGLFSVESEKNLMRLDMRDRVSPSGRPGFYKIDLQKRIEIHHTTQYARSKTYRDVSHPVSWIETEKGYMIVGQDGFIANNEEIVTSGEFNQNRIASMLPLNYSPGSFVVVNYLTKRNIAKRLQERAFIQTDKALYYGGEQIWFKTHLNYANQSVRDSLSQVLYVDVIKNQQVIHSVILKIDSMGARGNIEIPETWEPGYYSLRVYTSWMLNYGQRMQTSIPIIICDNQYRLKVKQRVLSMSPSDFKWLTDVRGDTVALHVSLDSTMYRDWANCSISIIPQELAIWDNSSDFKKAFIFDDDLPDGSLAEFMYPIEYGFSLQGKITHPKKQNMVAKMTVIRGVMDTVYTFRTDRKGKFGIDELSFYDSSIFSFQARDKRGRIFGKTVILPKSTPTNSFLTDGIKLTFDTVQFKKPPEFHKDKKIEEPTSVEVAAKPESFTNLNADYILTSSELEKMPGNQSLMLALQGRIPGLQFNSSGRSLTFRGGGMGVNSNEEPLFVVDGIPMFTQQSNKQPAPPQPQTQTQQSVAAPDQANRSPAMNNQDISNANQNQNTRIADASSQQNFGGSSAMDLISHITVSGVSRVEITSRADTRYGTMGANGVIAIYTKKVQGKGDKVRTFDIFQIPGFKRPDNFMIAQNRSDNEFSEYTPTQYWNPDMRIDSKRPLQISLTALSPNTIFQVTIMGVTNTGIPVTGCFLLEGGSLKPLSASLDQRQK